VEQSSVGWGINSHEMARILQHPGQPTSSGSTTLTDPSGIRSYCGLVHINRSTIHQLKLTRQFGRSRPVKLAASAAYTRSTCQKFSLRSCFGGDFWRAAKTGSRRCTPVTFGRQPAQVFTYRAGALKVCLRSVEIFDWKD